MEGNQRSKHITFEKNFRFKKVKGKFNKKDEEDTILGGLSKKAKRAE